MQYLSYAFFQPHQTFNSQVGIRQLTLLLATILKTQLILLHQTAVRNVSTLKNLLHMIQMIYQILKRNLYRRSASY